MILTARLKPSIKRKPLGLTILAAIKDLALKEPKEIQNKWFPNQSSRKL
jgi:hypothetical protein